MSKITLQNISQLAERIGFAEHLDVEADKSTPSSWGIARFIRREIRRHGLVTRRELKKTMEPFLSAAGFSGDTSAVIRHVADQMVDVGEIVELRVENQRGYAALSSRWVRICDSVAVLLGTTATEKHRFETHHPQQFLRRFQMQASIIADLEKAGIYEQLFEDWLGDPGWKRFCVGSDRIDSLTALLDWHIERLEKEGVPFLSNTRVRAIQLVPGKFFGQPGDESETRWTAPCNLLDGVYLGAEPGVSERQWRPLILKIVEGEGKSIILHHGYESSAGYELRNWLLLAIGSADGKPEKVVVDCDNNELKLTFPPTPQLTRCLRLAGEVNKPWRYSVLNSRVVVERLQKVFPEIDFIFRS